MAIHEKPWFWMIVFGFILLLISLGRYAIKKSIDGWVRFTLWSGIILLAVGTIMGLMSDEEQTIQKDVVVITHPHHQKQQVQEATNRYQTRHFAPVGSNMYPTTSVGYSVVSNNDK